MSLVGSPPPLTVSVGGEDVPINTSHHCGVRVAAIIDDPTIDDRTARAAILANYFPGIDISHYDQNALFEAAIVFHRCGEPLPDPNKAKKKRKKSAARIWDWEYDAGFLVSDFQREYRLDITNPKKHIHWWRFKILVDGLSDTSSTMTVRGIRGRSLSNCKSKEERELLIKQKKAVALPPRTASEVVLDI